MIYNDFVHLFLLTEGYSDVKNRLKEQGFDETKLDNLFNFHQKYKFKFKNTSIDNNPIDASNIDAYFSKANIVKYTLNKLVNALIERQAEIQASLPTQTKAESKIEDLKKLLVAETNDYVFFKVPTWEDAVKLKRVGKNNPWNLPPMIPVEWCVTADSKQGKRMFEYYTNRGYDMFELPSVIKYSIDGDKLFSVDLLANFYFFFRKNNSIKNNKFDYVAINSINNGSFAYTTSPNSSMNLGWPKEVPIELQSKIEFPKHIKKLKGYVDNLSAYKWASILKISPDLYSKCDKFNDFNTSDWSYVLEAHPKLFIKLFEKYYKSWKDFSISDWVILLKSDPIFVELFNKYNGKWDEINSDGWISILQKQPQLIQYCFKYDIFENFGGDALAELIEQYPAILKIKRFQDFMNKRGWKRFINADWAQLLLSHPEFASKCDEYNVWKDFDIKDWEVLLRAHPEFTSKIDNLQKDVWDDFRGDNWAYLLSNQPKFISKCDEYNGWEKFDMNDWWSVYFDAKNEFAKQIEQRAQQYPAGRKMLQDFDQ